MLAWHGRMSRDGVIRHHLDRLTEEDLPEQFGAATRRPEASGGCANSETADADLNQIVGSFGVRSPLVSMWLLFPFWFCRPIRVNAHAPANGASSCPTRTQTCLSSRSGRTPKTPVHIRRSRFDKLPPVSASLGLRHPYSWMNMTFSSPGTVDWKQPDRSEWHRFQP